MWSDARHLVDWRPSFYDTKGGHLGNDARHLIETRLKNDIWYPVNLHIMPKKTGGWCQSDGRLAFGIYYLKVTSMTPGWFLKQRQISGPIISYRLL